jgi:hypothetical protein
MKFKIGDHVAVIDDVLKGIVSEISGNTVVVESSDGFIFKFSEDELVVIKESQSELSKYSDISNKHLWEKKDIENKKRPIFKSDIRRNEQAPMEVDLHINQLVDSKAGLDPMDILNLQIDTAKRQLEFAIRNHISKIVFIHGVGAGVLKTELEYLMGRYEVQHYPASYKKYGMGAMEVYIYQNPKNSL